MKSLSPLSNPGKHIEPRPWCYECPRMRMIDQHWYLLYQMSEYGFELSAGMVDEKQAKNATPSTDANLGWKPVPPIRNFKCKNIHLIG